MVQDSTDHGCRDRTIGSLLAGAVGDAAGTAIKFLDWETIRTTYGPRGVRVGRPLHSVRSLCESSVSI